MKKHRWLKTSSDPVHSDDDQHHPPAPIPTVAFKTPRHVNGMGSAHFGDVEQGNALSSIAANSSIGPPPLFGSADINKEAESSLQHGENSPKAALKIQVADPGHEHTALSVRFRDRSKSPPPRPPPPIMRAKTIKARGGATTGDDYDDNCHRHSEYDHSSVEESRSHGSQSASVTFMSQEDVPFFGSGEEGYMHGYGTVIDDITKTVKARGGREFMHDDLIGNEDEEEQEEENVPRSARYLWAKMRDRVKRGSFMVHSFSSHRSGNFPADDDTASVQGSIFSGGGSVTKEESKRSASSAAFSELDLPYELTLSECCGAIILYLLIGVIAYSFIFEHWSIVDSLYFSIVTGTLVGFGDITPSNNPAKLFTSVFAITSVAFLGLVIGVLGSRMVEYEVNAVQKANNEMKSQITGFFRFKTKRRETSGLPRTSSQESCASLQSTWSYASLESLESLQNDPSDGSVFDKRVIDEHARWYRQMFGLLCRYLPAMIPILLASLLVAFLEEWNLCDAFYFFVVTTATIGYGDIVPQTDAMKIFAVFFIPLAVGAVGHTLGTVANFIIERRREIYQKKIWSQELKVGDLAAMDRDMDGLVSKLDYVEFMLLTLKKVDADLLNELHEQFAQLDTNRSGSLTKRDLQHLAKKRLRKVRHKLKLSSYKHQLLHKNQESKKTLYNK